MSLAGKRILLTGATGGLGQALALILAQQGARLALVGRNQDKLSALNQLIAHHESQHCIILNDFSSPKYADDVFNEAIMSLGGVDIIINNAASIAFAKFVEHEPQDVDRMMHLNTIVPMQLTRAALPYFLQRGAGHIVNIGSIFGSIGFPHYAVYSASKFALRGFSQALRRELLDSGLKISYIAPRAIKTSMNNEAAMKTLNDSNSTIDSVEFVANKVLHAITHQKEEYYIGQPESFFARLNGVFPSIVSLGLKQATRVARQYL